MTIAISAFILFFHLWASRCWASVIDPDSAATGIVVLFSEVIVSVMLLGFFGMLDGRGLLFLGILQVLLITLWEVRVRRKTPSAAKKQQSLQPVSWRMALIDHQVTFLLLFALLALVIVVNLFVPIAEIDSVAYHLPIVSQLVHTHGVWNVFTAGFVGPNTYFPANHEALQAFLVIVFGGYHFQYIITFLSVVLFVFSLQEMAASKRFGVAAFVSVFVLASTPVLFVQFVTAQVDLFLFCIMGSAFTFLCTATLQRKRSALINFFLMLGLAIGTKYSVLVQAAVVLPIVLWLFYDDRKSLHQLWWLPFLAILTGGWWYLRNLLLTGNPVYPFDLRLGFIHFEGHAKALLGMAGSSLWDAVKAQGLRPIIKLVLSDKAFPSLPGPVPLISIILAIIILVCLIIIRLVRGKKRSQDGTLTLILAYIFIAQLLCYAASPFTFLYWSETVRYAATWFATIPVIFFFAAHRSMVVRWLLIAWGSAAISYNIFLKSVLVSPSFAALRTQILPALPSMPIVMALLQIAIGSTLLLLLRPSDRFGIAALRLGMVSVCAICAFAVLPVVAHTDATDTYLSQELLGYAPVLPHLERLRSEKRGVIALAGPLLYWIFEKEGFTPLYVNIDGCGTCMYPDYRHEEESIRAHPQEQAWKLLLRSVGAQYLLVGTSHPRNRGVPLYEETWAEADPMMFQKMLSASGNTLYRIKQIFP